MRQQVAIAVDGVWQFQEVVGDDDRRSVALASPMDAMDEVVAQLSRVVMLAQDMSDEDQRRVRDFVHAASAMLLATTYLNTPDQKTFESALRTAARK